MMKRLAVLFLLTLAATSAWAGFGEGLAAYQKGDYVTALKEWQPLAEQGNVDAQHNLGVMYGNGLGVQKNDAESIRWCRKAADQGDANAQTRLAGMYFKGEGVQKDDAEAFKWYRKASEQGNLIAQGLLGFMYANGNGVEKNLGEAERVLKLVVSNGNDSQKGFAKEILATIQESKACLKKASTMLFGEALNCTTKGVLRRVLKNGGLKVIREDDGYWYDQYDSSEALEGSNELSVAYIGEKFAKADYKFNSNMDTGKVVEVRNMVNSKYGKPAISSGNPNVGEVKYVWNLKDGIKVEVTRGWPDTTVYLQYIHPANFADIEEEQARQKQEAEAKKLSKQNKAF